MEKTIEYYKLDKKSNTIEHLVAKNYTISKDPGDDTRWIIKNITKNSIISQHKHGEYYKFSIYIYDKKYQMNVARAVLSTFVGPPPTLHHTADHIASDQKLNDSLENLRWFGKSGQRNNQTRPDRFKSAFIIIKDGVEMTANEWMKKYKKSSGSSVSEKTIREYAVNKTNGFSYKEYPDFPGEIWKPVENSSNKVGRWEVSNMNRIAYISKHARNVISGNRLRKSSGYPFITINGKSEFIHIIVFRTFFPEEWKNKRSEDIVLHKYDDRLDFRPENLRLGSPSENRLDAYKNGKYDGTKSAHRKVVIYSILNERLAEFGNLHDAARYVVRDRLDITIESVAASISRAIDSVCKDGKCRVGYGYIWKSS